MASTRSSTTTPARTNGSAVSKAASTGWVHTPSSLTVLWLFVSIPLVVWDCGYVLGRPHTMEGGWMHAPVWTLYKLYGEVDQVYGWKAFNARSGFTGAQGWLNVIETAMYVAYLVIYYRSGFFTAGNTYIRSLSGRPAAWAVLLAYSSAVMTLSKTVLYWLNELFSGFDNIGHNSWDVLIPLWIVPNGAWLILPCWMIYELGTEMLDVLTSASTGATIKKD